MLTVDRAMTTAPVYGLHLYDEEPEVGMRRNAMGLTAQQIEQFNRDGYLAYGPLLTLGEVNKLLAHYADLFIKETSYNIREQAEGETRDFRPSNHERPQAESGIRAARSSSQGSST